MTLTRHVSLVAAVGDSSTFYPLDDAGLDLQCVTHNSVVFGASLNTFDFHSHGSSGEYCGEVHELG